jgi:hypothetical protein
MTMTANSKLLFQGPDWDFDLIKRVHEACGEIGINEMGLDPYPNQIEVITTEQMLDAYASTGMPLFYRHWSFGKHFARNEAMYRKGYQGLAYEIVINSNPCILYIMEENSATMQTLVLAQLKDAILPICQYYAYVEVGMDDEDDHPGAGEPSTNLWRAYRRISVDAPFAMRKVKHRRDIYPVFRELFARRPEGAAAEATS